MPGTRVRHSQDFDSLIFTAKSFGLEHQNVGLPIPNSASLPTLVCDCDNRIEHTRVERDAKAAVEPTCDTGKRRRELL